MLVSIDELIPAIIVELFITIHMCAFVIMPISQVFAKYDSKKVFWSLLAIRFAVLGIGNVIIPYKMMIFDVTVLFIGAFICIPLLTFVTSMKINKKNTVIKVVDDQISKIPLYNDFEKMGFSDPNLLVKELIRFYNEIYSDMSNGNYNNLKNICSPGVYLKFDNIIKHGLEKGIINKYEDIELVAFKVIEAKKINSEMYVTLNIEIKVLDYIVDTNGNVISGNNLEKVTNYRKVSFSKKLGNKLIKKCPSCGGMIYEKGVGFCSYCGIQIDSSNSDWVLKSDALIDKL